MKRVVHCKVQGRSVVSCAKTAELIKMPFGLWTLVCHRNHELDGVQTPIGRGNFEGEKGGRSTVNIGTTVRVRRRCGYLSNYFDYLFLCFLVLVFVYNCYVAVYFCTL